MQDPDTTAGVATPDVDNQDQVEQMLRLAAQELPLVNLAGCMDVHAEVLPHDLMRLTPACSYVSKGDHPIPTEFVWKDIDTKEIYCHLRCAALDAIERAVRIARIENLR